MEKIFESERINYVKISKELVDDYLKMVNDKEIQQCISNEPYTFSYEEELTWIKLKIEDNANIFSMIEKSTNEFIGNIEIIKTKDNVGELGISITKDKQNKHYGTESIKRILKYCFDILKLENVYLNVHGNNERAIKCYENCGFVIDGEGQYKGDFHMIYQRNK